MYLQHISASRYPISETAAPNGAHGALNHGWDVWSGAVEQGPVREEPKVPVVAHKVHWIFHAPFHQPCRLHLDISIASLEWEESLHQWWVGSSWQQADAPCSMSSSRAYDSKAHQFECRCCATHTGHQNGDAAGPGTLSAKSP